MGANTKNGYMRVANEIMEALIKTPLSGREYKVLLFIMRQTYGYNHSERGMSLAYLAENLNIRQKHISEILISLKEKNIITCVKQTGNSPQVIGINPALEEWQGIPEKRYPRKRVSLKKGIPENGDTSIPEFRESGIPEKRDKVSPNSGRDTLLKTDNKDRYIKTEEKTECCGSSEAQKIADLFNLVCVSFPKVVALTAEDSAAIGFTLEKYCMQKFETVFRKAENSPFLKGRNPRKWRASFYWLVRIANFEKVLNGKYDDLPEPTAPAEKAAESSFDINEWYRQAESYDPETILDDT